MMISCIKPYQFVKHDKDDYLIPKGDRFYIKTRYAGVVEITKKTYEELLERGVEVR